MKQVLASTLSSKYICFWFFFYYNYILKAIVDSIIEFHFILVTFM